MKYILFFIPFLLSCLSVNSEALVCKDDDLNIESFIVDKTTGTRKLAIIKDVSEELHKLDDYGELSVNSIKGLLFSTTKINAASSFVVLVRPYNTTQDYKLLEQQIKKEDTYINLNIMLDPNLFYKFMYDGPVVYTFIFSGEIPNLSKFKSEICFDLGLKTNKSLF